MIDGAKQTINSIEDAKTKLHEQNLSMIKAVEDITDKELSIQNNIKILEVENDKIKV